MFIICLKIYYLDFYNILAQIIGNLLRLKIFYNSKIKINKLFFLKNHKLKFYEKKNKN